MRQSGSSNCAPRRFEWGRERGLWGLMEPERGSSTCAARGWGWGGGCKGEEGQDGDALHRYRRAAAALTCAARVGEGV
eukprot:5473854-Prymnesium_polylepis.1